MARVKKAVNALKTRRNILRRAKGYRFRRSTNERAAYEALMHAGAYAFAHRRDKKGDRRSVNIIKINAALDAKGLSYSKFMGAMKKKGIALDRKVLADLAHNNPETFDRIVAQVK
ncbi:MAG TPA: 50S ribosomal protein L20 [Candidatus Paceibacterota bacterium]|nr:50S ribosomal protein L20 [Candidatus Paceibacterota bacterium]